MDLPYLSIDSRKLREHYLQGMSEAHKKIANHWGKLGVKVDSEMLYPNRFINRNAYSVDIMLYDYNTIVEIDGPKHIGREEKDRLRDEHIKKYGQQIGEEWEIVRIPLEIPQDLIYGHLAGNKKTEVKEQYEQWLFKKADRVLDEIRQNHLKKLNNKLQNLKHVL